MTDPKDRLFAAGEKLVDEFRGQWSRLWILGAALILIVVSLRSCITLEPGQVAVRVNNITGSKTTITRPGLIVRLPFGLHSVYTLDASRQTFNMQGESNQDALHVKELTVRSSDGSNFVFKDTQVHFRVLGDQAQSVLADAGTGNSYKNWMRPFTRSVLRDEFGLLSTLSASNPVSFKEATEKASTRMNAILNQHGIEVTQIATPRPRFTEEYEELIESRNEAENQMSVISSELERAGTERERRLAEVNRDQNRSIKQKKAELEAALATASAQQAETMQSVDTLRIEQVGKGQAALSASVRQAEELRGQLEAVYQARKAEIDAFRNQPVERVMERLGERLEGVTIDIQPWSNDATPSRIQMQQAAGGAR